MTAQGEKEDLQPLLLSKVKEWVKAKWPFTNVAFPDTQITAQAGLFAIEPGTLPHSFKTGRPSSLALPDWQVKATISLSEHLPVEEVQRAKFRSSGQKGPSATFHTFFVRESRSPDTECPSPEE
jgi:hypothetical protein